MNQYNEADVRALWRCARTHNSTIPDDALDAMRAALEAALSAQPAPERQGAVAWRAPIAAWYEYFESEAAAIKARAEYEADHAPDVDHADIEPLYTHTAAPVECLLTLDSGFQIPIVRKGDGYVPDPRFPKLQEKPAAPVGVPEPLPMDAAPRDGTMLRLLVCFTEHATDDAEEAWTIGSNSFDANGEDVWQFAGWCWTHDHFTEGKGTPIGWLPMLAAAPSVPQGTQHGEGCQHSWVTNGIGPTQCCKCRAFPAPTHTERK